MIALIDIEKPSPAPGLDHVSTERGLRTRAHACTILSVLDCDYNATGCFQSLPLSLPLSSGLCSGLSKSVLHRLTHLNA